MILIAYKPYYINELYINFIIRNIFEIMHLKQAYTKFLNLSLNLDF